MKITRKSLLSSFITIRKKRILVLVLVLLGILGLIYMRYTWTSANLVASDYAMTIARTAETSLPENAISWMENPSKNDSETIQYQQIKSNLQNLVSINQTIEFAYIYVERDSKLYFMADSEVVDSRVYSPSGLEYAEADKVYRKPFKDGKSIITNPVTDRWGTWVSVLVPIKDVETGQVRAVLGMDYPAKMWSNPALYNTLQAGIVVLTMALLILALFWISMKNEVVKAEGHKLILVNENLDNLFNSIDDLLYVFDKQGKILHVNSSVYKRLGYSEDELIGKSVLLLHPENRREEPNSSVIDTLSNKVHYLIPVITKYGQEIPVETHITEGEWNGERVSFGVMKDISAITRSEEKFSKAFNSVSVLMEITRLEDSRYLDVNDAFLETLGFDRAEVIGRKSSDLNVYFDGERNTIDEVLESAGKVHNLEVSIRGRDGSVHTCICSAEYITIGETPCLLKSLTDITIRKEIEEELIKSEQKYKLLFSAMNDAFSHQSIICDELGKAIDYRFITTNSSFETMTGLKSDAIIGKSASEVLPGVDQAVIEIYGRVALTGESAHFNTFSTVLNKYFEVKAYSPSSNEFATIYMDITERVENEKNIHYLNYHDVLTGLYNRRFYEEEIRRLNTERNLPISLIFGDVNGLKLINDAFGHLKGDELLQKAARAIRSTCRTDDIVARLGGDEFVILLPKTTAIEAEEIVERIRSNYSKEQVNSISGSISFGWNTKCSMDEDILVTLKNAEDLMYKNKILESEKIRLDTIKALIKTLHEKYPGTEQDSKRVGELCQDMGRAIGLSEAKVSRLRTAGFLHDIGNVAIEEGILNKPGKPLDQEWEEIKRHSENGYRILSSSHEMSEIADYVLAHHERWDGTGYPKGLRGEDIPIEARIIAIASSYVAMTSERLYRSAFQEEAALQEILKNAGTQFDPEIVKVFLEKMQGHI